MMDVQRVALEAIAALRPLIDKIAVHDRALAKQMKESTNSFVLNIGEAERSDPGNARARWNTAAGSVSETRSALRAACAWDYVQREEAAEADLPLDRLAAMLWRLGRPRARPRPRGGRP